MDHAGSAQVRPYLPFRDGYFVHNGVVLYYDRIVIPLSLRRKVLSILHSAHQGVSAIERRARATVFWPGMTKDIRAVRSSCVYCNRNAPSQAATPPMGLLEFEFVLGSSTILSLDVRARREKMVYFKQAREFKLLAKKNRIRAITTLDCWKSHLLFRKNLPVPGRRRR